MAQHGALHIAFLGQGMISGGLEAFAGKRILLLQGPLGPFFHRLAIDLRRAGAEVLKVNFNGGDLLFSPQGSICFRGSRSEWGPFFERLLTEHRIDTVLLFGDCRPLHRIAHEIADRRGIEIGVFEEGYIRPDYVTLERYGVNGHSRIPRALDFYLRSESHNVPPTTQVGNMFWHAVCWALLYYIASAILWPLFRHYEHHRPLTLLESLPWIRGAWRKTYYAYKEKGVQLKLSTDLSKQFFLVPLQVHNDAQVHVHSAFTSVEKFISHVVASFAANAPGDTVLVIKHHPMDRGYHDYAKLIRRLGANFNIGERLLYIHDQHLPTLLDHARGVVLINSTVGLSALTHGAPLKVCGNALYDLYGLTYQSSLDRFWTEAATFSVRRDLFQRFLNYLISTTQLNGSFYRRLRLPGSAAGLVWMPPKQVSETASPVTDSTIAVTARKANKVSQGSTSEVAEIADVMTP